MTPLRLKGCMVFVLLLSVSTCAVAERSAHELEVLYDGCESRDYECPLDEKRTLVVWVARPRAATADRFLRVEQDGRVLSSVEVVPAGVGVRLTISPVRDGLLRLIPTDPDYRPFELRLGEARPAAALVRQARELRADGKGEVARDLLLKQAATLDSEQQPAALSVLGRIQRALGDFDSAWATLERARRGHREAGAIGAYINDTTLLVYVAGETNRRLNEAAEALSELDSIRTQHASSVYLVAYYRGFIARLLGDLVQARRWFAESAKVALRMGWQSRYSIASEFSARVDQSLGNHTRAIETFAQLVDETSSSDPCRRATLLNNYAWALLLGDGFHPRAAPLEDRTVRVVLNRALAQLADCDELPALEAEIRANVALEALRSGDTPAATAEMKRLDTLPLSLDTVRWLEDLRGQIALATNRPRDALEHYRALDNQSSSSEQSWRAAVGVARAHQASGKVEASHEAYSHAFTLEQREGLSIPFELGRGEFLAQRDTVAREFVESLLQHGHSNQALKLTRTRRALSIEGRIAAQRIEGLDPGQRSEWSLVLSRYREQRDALDREVNALRTAPKSERAQRGARIRDQRERVRLALRDVLTPSRVFTTSLAVPAGVSESLRLSFFDLGDRWVGWAHVRGGADARIIEKPRDPNQWSQAMLKAFDDEIEGATMIRIVGGPELEELSFATAPWRGQLLGAVRPVLRSIDLPARRETGPSGTALVVADPNGDLPWARSEATEVSRRLRELGYTVQVLRGRAARRVQVAAALEAAELFHYAGHGPDQSEDGWASGLPMADGVLSVADVLAASHVPKVVVLSACDGARGDGVSIGSGLAQSFLVSGSDYVLASIDPVPDRVATRVSRLFWSRFQPADHVPIAWMRTVGVLQSGPWSSFRLLSR
ncbi:MAG: CHAT domain-containing protein [Myxococcota bacterium]